MIRAIPYASCYVYSPAGTEPLCRHSRLLRSLLKASDAAFIRRYAQRVQQQAEQSPRLAGFFDASDILVPVPGCVPRRTNRAWVAEDLALALLHAGLGQGMARHLLRVRCVRKSATAKPGTRPSVNRHYESFAIEQFGNSPERVVLIDDVITRGRTLLAAAARLHEAFPQAQIRAFALLRTLGRGPQIRTLLDPVRGEIRWQYGDARRRP